VDEVQFSGQLLFGSKDIAADELSHVRAGLAYVGLVLSLIWYVFGAEDRFLVERYRDQVKEAAMKIRALVPNARYHGYVGQTEYRDHQDDPRLIEYNDPSSWRIEPISTTRLGALFPLCTFLLWLSLVLVFLSSRS
jgi:hypothetical protein